MREIQKKLTNGFYAMLALPATAMGFALSVQISALSWILSTKYGLNIEEVGFVWAAGPLAGIFGQIIVGLVSDNVWFWGGRRRPFILVGGTLAALMLVCLPNIDTIADFFGFADLLPVALFVALTLDMAINISFNPTRSIIADVTPEGQTRTKGYTWMQTISGFFGVLAYVIGASFNNYILIWVGVGLVLAFSLVPTLFVTEPRHLDTDDSEDLDLTDASHRKSNIGQLLRIYFANGFSWIGVQTMFVFMFAYSAQMLYGTTETETLAEDQKNNIGQVIAISFAVLNTLGFIMPALVLEPLARKIGRVNTHSLFMLVMSLAYGGIVLFGDTPMAVYILMGFAGMGWACIVSLPFAIMSEKVNKARMGFFMGVFNLSIVIPQLIVSLFIGKFIARQEDMNVIFMISAAALFLSFLSWKLVKDSGKTEVPAVASNPSEEF
jgi:maltose/moltooligosaccharide transporter